MLWFEKISAELDVLAAASQAQFPLVLKMTAILWIIQIINAFLHYRLNVLGIMPRRFWGLIGIPFSPFLHSSFSHLTMNTPPFMILTLMVLMYGTVQFYYVTLLIVCMTGILIWLVGRPALHIGSSGLVMGYWGYTLMNAYSHFNLNSVILAVVCLYYFGSFYMNVFPEKREVSWEAHLFGLMSGIGVSYLLPVPAVMLGS